MKNWATDEDDYLDDDEQNWRVERLQQ
jgi:hypothetical protein